VKPRNGRTTVSRGGFNTDANFSDGKSLVQGESFLASILIVNDSSAFLGRIKR